MVPSSKLVLTMSMASWLFTNSHTPSEASTINLSPACMFVWFSKNVSYDACSSSGAFMKPTRCFSRHKVCVVTGSGGGLPRCTASVN